MIRKSVLSVFIALALVFCVSCAAESVSGTAGDIQWEITQKGELVIRGNGSMSGFSFYSDTAAWKEYRDRIRSVRIEKGVTDIAKYAFRNCDRITSVTIPGTVKDIGEQAFRGCAGLTAAAIPEGVASIGNWAFRDCAGMRNITVPASVKKIGKDAFLDCGGSNTLVLSYTKADLNRYLDSISFYLTVSPGSYAAEYAAREDISYDDGKQKVLSMRAKEAETADRVVAGTIREGMNEKQKAKALHDWVIMNSYYSYYGGWSVLAYGTGTCEEYAFAYSLLLSRAGIANTIVHGDANGGPHAWNLVRIDGKWYHVDTTFDDPGTAQRPVSGYERSAYFMLTDAQMRRDHSWDGFSADNAVLPYGEYFDPAD